MTTIFSNDLPNPQDRKAVGAAVLDALGNREMRAYISEPQNSHYWTVRIEGPNGFVWKRDFMYDEERPEFVAEAIRKMLRGNGL
jgi:hypothetical protein